MGAMKNPFDLSGQVAVITGSSRGIGRSAAEIMASLGAKVVVSSRKAEACEEVVAAITKAGGEATQSDRNEPSTHHHDRDGRDVDPEQIDLGEPHLIAPASK